VSVVEGGQCRAVRQSTGVHCGRQSAVIATRERAGSAWWRSDVYPVNLAIVAWCTSKVLAIARQLSPAARRLRASSR
jgi:hypothetical protein